MKNPFITLEKALEIKAKYSTPFHIYDESGIENNIGNLKKAFSWNKGFKEYFAVKATPNPAILKIMKKAGFGLDCSSLTELMMAERLGFFGEDIMFSSNETAAEEYIYAKKLGAIINLDDITHIDFLEKHAGIPDKISLRYNPGGEFKIGTQIMGNPADAKYGLTTEQMYEAIEILQKKGVRSFGIHAFLASNTKGNSYYPELAGLLFKLIQDLKEKTGAKFDFVNLSGGIGIPYKPEEEEVDIIEVGNGVQKVYNEVFNSKETGGLSIYTELGRFMLAPYGGLVTEVLHFKHTYKEYVGVDACAAHLMRPAIYGAYHHITVLGKENNPIKFKYDVVGSLCENSDKFAIDRFLPKIEYGDILFIHDTGAHGHSMGYNYNGKLRSSEIMLKQDGTFSLIRRAETSDDYFATLDIYPEFSKK
ncbi:MAG: Diaminopimelate decarboxylase [Firmicutes bacterium ADurb.Bin080]|jgi:diaminopimelate decarboxylase|nr:diaminopimelate decarboxylase [Clostridiales bacterium]OQC15085.1 MAG: Diaminopimelate decarboxylase [Firmicutes bacterium ADurb.Bin080]